MAPRYLINENGDPFDAAELKSLARELESLDENARTAFRNANADAIATHSGAEILIVAGPGTGKSTLFKRRALHWLGEKAAANILAVSFVRKLVADLHSDIQNDERLSDRQKKQVDVHTLHKYARSIVEQNNGTKAWPFTPHFRMISQEWKEVVWTDVLLLSELNSGAYPWKHFEKQLYDEAFEDGTDWRKLKKTYFTLCQFYNAAGFSDIILRAKETLAENPKLNRHHFFIFDEYQDFNTSEENLLNEMTNDAAGVLIVGDDDQVLYETLKSGKASLIRGIYKNTDIINAMLPYCGRCDFHIAHAARHFIRRAADADCISKIYLPLGEVAASEKVQVIACATPTTAVDYIRKFIEDHNEEIERRKQDLAEEKEKDAYLLILSPSRDVNFYRPKGAREELFECIQPYKDEQREFSADYHKVLNYYALANYPKNNFTFRKVLYYENVSRGVLKKLLQTCIDGSQTFSSADDENTKNALAKAGSVRKIIDSKESPEKKIEELKKHIEITDADQLRRDLEQDVIDKQRVEAIEHQEEEQAVLEEIEVKKMSAVELMTIVGSKGLSADHVIMIGFDNVNMSWVTRNAFYVAVTRARKSLHMITALGAGGAQRAHGFLSDLPDRNVDFTKYTKGNRTQEALDGRRGFLRYLESLNTQRRRR